ncbi:MAG: hypothetical protein AAF242_06680 [Bacteroidota bacterium]
MPQIEKTKINYKLFPNSTSELRALRSGKWQVYDEDETETFYSKQEPHKVRSGLTFTPYANPTRCNAHCRFCSEELIRKHQKERTASNLILDHHQYFIGLAKALQDLSAIQEIGLSLSGLEATSDPTWLIRLLTLLGQKEGVPKFNEKVLYTNGSGLYKYPEILTALGKAQFDRFEISRCHYDEAINQSIMYINRNEPVYQNTHYEQLIGSLVPAFNVKNSCILTQTGIHTIVDVEYYLDWVRSLGVKKVVFRELSRLDKSYRENRTKLWIEKNRVPIDTILQQIMPRLGTLRKGWKYQYSRAGYYYYNESFRYQNEVDVILETSSYTALNANRKEEIIQKLVFHSNGNLCGGWDPNREVIASYF